MLTIDLMKTMEPDVLDKTLTEIYTHTVPICIDTIEEMVDAGKLMSTIANEYSFLMSALSSFKIMTKVLKENKDKDASKMAMRRDSIESAVERLKFQYGAISRLITIKQQINYELKMTGAM